MSAQVKPFACAALQTIALHASRTSRVAFVASRGMLTPGRPIQSLYRLIVRKMVGFPARRATIWEKTLSNFGWKISAAAAAQVALNFDQSGLSLVGPSHGSSLRFQAISLAAMPTIMMSALASALRR